MKGTLIVGLTAAALGLAVAPATAQGWSTPDPAHDAQGGFHGQGDIIRVDTKHTMSKLVVNTVFRVAPYDALTIRINTHDRHRGAEYYFYRGEEAFGSDPYVYDTVHKRAVRCPKLRIREMKKVWRAHIPRNCIKLPNGKRPSRVKVKVESAGYGAPYTFDWTPGKHRSSPWIKAG